MASNQQPMDETNESDDNEPNPAEIAQMRNASPSDASAVDALILGKCTTRWSKVAMIVGDCLDEFEAKFPQLPYVYMPIRMLELEDHGVLEIRGDVMAMRYSEIRLRGPDGND